MLVLWSSHDVIQFPQSLLLKDEAGKKNISDTHTLKKKKRLREQWQRKQYILLIISHALGTFLKAAEGEKKKSRKGWKGQNGQEKLEYGCDWHK